MTLKSGNEQLKRVSKQIDSLIEDIRTELLARDDASTPLTQDEIDEIVKGKLKYIANPLKNFEINGDTKALQDVIALYNSAIEQLDKIITDKKYSDEREPSESELKVFESAKEVLSTGKDQGAGAIYDIYSSIMKDYKKGKLFKDYAASRDPQSDERVDLEGKIADSDKQIDALKQPMLDLRTVLSPQLGICRKNRRIYQTISQLEERYEQENEKLEAAKKELTDARAAKDNKKISDARDKVKNAKEKSREAIVEAIKVIKESDPEKYKRKEFQKRDDEKLVDYADRLEREFYKPIDELRDKIRANYNRKIKVVEKDPNTGKYIVKEVTVKERYFDGKDDRDDVSVEEAIAFLSEWENDVKDIQGAINEINGEKATYQSQLNAIPRTEIPKAQAYPKKISAFAKWRQRLGFMFKHPEYFGKSKEEVERAMVLKKREEQGFGIEKKDVLKEIEERQRQFRADLAAKPAETKAQIKSDVEEKVFTNWDNRDTSGSDDGRG